MLERLSELFSDFSKISGLCLNIPKTVIDDNTHKKRIVEFNGICYKSNYSKDFKDLSPAWDYLSFKDRVELNK